MADRLTDAELQQIRARLEAATPGPWLPKIEDGAVQFIASSAGRYVAEADRPEDEDFILHAPASVRVLLDEVQRLSTEIETWRATLALYDPQTAPSE